MAFADAGIEMYDLSAACSAALIKGGNDKEKIVLDPSWEEQQNSIGLLTLVYSPSMGTITHLLQTGLFNTNQLAEV